MFSDLYNIIDKCINYICEIEKHSSISKKIHSIIRNKRIEFNDEDCEKLLYLIRKKRNNSLPNGEVKIIIYYLLISYFSSRDVRYFNEFLFFRKKIKIKSDIKDSFKSIFYRNIDRKGNHFFPMGPINIENNTVYHLQNYKFSNIKKVCLLGPPHIFKELYYRLKKYNLKVEVINIPYYDFNKIKNFIVSNDIILKIINFLYGVKYNFTTLNYNYKSEKISKYIKNKKFDIGVSRLGFIIRSNIFDSFPYGLLNGHNSLLPYIRGRSVLEYSLLFGMPIGTTVHKMIRKVDGGDIVNFYNYPELLEKNSIRRIKKILRNEWHKNILKSIIQIDQGYNLKNNDWKKGITYYPIHEWLISYINNKILR